MKQLCCKCNKSKPPELMTNLYANPICHECHKKMPKTICVDFDGVIADYNGWKGENHYGDPAPRTYDFLQRLKALRFYVVVFTTRGNYGINDWLKKHNLNQFVDEVTRIKPAAVCYIDDRAVQFTGDFNKTLAQIENFKPWWKE